MMMVMVFTATEAAVAMIASTTIACAAIGSAAIVASSRATVRRAMLFGCLSRLAMIVAVRFAVGS
jgi:hypothetical protein